MSDPYFDNPHGDDEPVANCVIDRAKILELQSKIFALKTDLFNVRAELDQANETLCETLREKLLEKEERQSVKLLSEPDLHSNSSNPICPYCGQDPVAVNIRNLSFPNGMVVLLASCANQNCRKVYSAAFLGMSQPLITPGRILQ